MKIFSNKFFVIGNLILLLLAIPVTLFFVKKQEEVRSRATAASQLYFNPASINTSTSCQSFNVDVMINPGSNVVSTVALYITFNPALLSVTQITPSSAFSGVLSAANISSGQANIQLNAQNGIDGTKAVTSITKVATITFVPKGTGNDQIQFDTTKTTAYATNQPSPAVDQNVLNNTLPANVTIGSSACLASASGTPPVISGAPPLNTSPTAAPVNQNQSPTCTNLTINPTTGGAAPFSVLFTGAGSDPNQNGLITQATFTFGDGQTQNVSSGLNQQTVSTQTSHTYQSAGTFTASVSFSDNLGSTSQATQACTQSINVTAASGSATITPIVSPTPTLVEKPTEIATPTLVEKPTMAATGNVAQTMGTLGVIVMSIVGGFFLLTL